MRNFALLGLMVMLALLPRAAAAQSPAAPPQEPASAMPPLENLEATRDRPLFSPQRRPNAEAPPEEAAVVEESPENLPFELTGVVIGSDTAIAILRNRDTQETVRLRQGENLEAWSLQEVATRHVVLRQEERQVRLELFSEKSDGPTPPSGLPTPVMTRPPPPPPPPPPVMTRPPPQPAAQRGDRAPARANAQQGTAVQRRVLPRRIRQPRRAPNL
jgi:general secretion pathway protein N